MLVILLLLFGVIALTPLDKLTAILPTPIPNPTATLVPSGGVPTATDFRFSFPWGQLFYFTANTLLLIAKFTWWVWPLVIILNLIRRKRKQNL